jgi:hypothetical protein
VNTISRNQLQTFMADANVQVRPIVQETAEIEGATIYGTFGDAQLVPLMTRSGYQDLLATPFRANRDQFAADPASRQNLIRNSTGRTYFIQMVDTSHPVIFTFMLVDREA